VGRGVGFLCAGMSVFLLTFTVAVSAAEGGRKATLYRDTWGVPHVYADTYVDAAYAIGYAQAEDRLDDIYKNIHTAVGTSAEWFGPENNRIKTDYVLRLIKNADRCKEYWATAPDFVRAPCEAFMGGVQAYLAEHPDKKPAFAVELEGWQCLAIGRTMILQWPLGTIMDDLDNKDKAPDFGSNSFAVSPSRSADGCAILMTDPHLTWEGMAVFYEARLHANDINVSGFFLVGTPLPALGHNANVAWACTTGGPDTSDVYMLKLRPGNPFQYEYKGQWKTFEPGLITINVKGNDPKIMPALYSMFGPLFAEPDTKKGVAYAGASPYIEQMGVFEQMYRMATAKNGDEFYQALAMNQMMEQNIPFADTDGNIRYVRNGCTPIRPDGYDWSAPVPRVDDTTGWLGFHDIADLVQIANPPQGYFQNCNVSPAVMMRDSPMTPDKYKPYIYNVTWDKTSPRGARLLELLDADDSVTKEEAMEYTLNIFDRTSAAWQAALKAAIDSAGTTRMADADFAAAAEALLNWDCQFAADAKPAALMKFWRLKCQDAVDVVAIADGNPLSMEDQVKMLGLLADTIQELKQKYGAALFPWGHINLIGRGGKYFACPGADFGGGRNKRNQTETVMDVSSREDKDLPGKYVAFNGSSSIMLSFLSKEGVDSYSLINWGQSGDPNSPHYMDQGEKLYAQRKFKPTWFKKEDLLQHIESQKEIVIP